MHFNIKTKSTQMLGDIITPVQLYFKIRDQFPNSLLLESSDYNSKETSFSFICCNPIASIETKDGKITKKYPNGKIEEIHLENKTDFASIFDEFIHQFKSDSDHDINGFFGYASYDSIEYFENITLSAPKSESSDIPELYYAFYQNIISFNHYYNEITLIENIYDQNTSTIPQIKGLINSHKFQTFPFKIDGERTSNLTDEAYKEAVTKGKNACYRGDVFQIVPSRQFQQKFKGDDFNVYRALRSINPSPYLFYFDYGSFKIFGSSPEAQLVIKNNEAYIDPIAGTIKRSGNLEKDAELAQILANDPKENAEHVMLVDLARNDLSRNSKEVKVKDYKEIQYFSHVLHMVSRVTAKLSKNINSMKVFGDTFPAGTLTGAPKYKAMQLIDQFENQRRGTYGGGIGFIGLNGDINTAIIIRTFVSKSNTLYFQAGAGVVAKSKEENELQEVNNKLEALNKAIIKAEKISNN
ncbi:anthranilate synthase [Flavobacteriaceae bacterium UJ101]|nr:anthranilate synthase [Flavobacteriaceae bacterium UJ101]